MKWRWFAAWAYVVAGLAISVTVDDLGQRRCEPKLTQGAFVAGVVGWGIIVPAAVAMIAINPEWKFGHKDRPQAAKCKSSWRI